MMGGVGLTEATKVAILNANYMAHRLASYYPVLYKGKAGLVAHECILDLRSLKKSAAIEVEDIAKRLMDYGYHAPTVYFPLVVPEALMVEPTETEGRETLDRFADAMLQIAKEAVETPEVLTSAPTKTPVRRVDEASANRTPVITVPMD